MSFGISKCPFKLDNAAIRLNCHTEDALPQSVPPQNVRSSKVKGVEDMQVLTFPSILA